MGCELNWKLKVFPKKQKETKRKNTDGVFSSLWCTLKYAFLNYKRFDCNQYGREADSAPWPLLHRHRLQMTSSAWDSSTHFLGFSEFNFVQWHWTVTHCLHFFMSLSGSFLHLLSPVVCCSPDLKWIISIMYLLSWVWHPWGLQPVSNPSQVFSWVHWWGLTIHISTLLCICSNY